MSVYKIDNSNDSQVELVLNENGIDFKRYETSTHAFVADVLEDAAVVYPGFETLSSEEVNSISDSLIECDWTNYVGGYIEGFLGKSITKDKE